MRTYQAKPIRIEGNRKTLHNICDVVRGCVGARREAGGCYGSCYAMKMARMAGVDFSTPVPMILDSAALKRSLKRCKQRWIRVGVSGDPSLDWEKTVQVCELIHEAGKIPVVITKGWKMISEGQLVSFRRQGTILHVSISGLDGWKLVNDRLDLIARYREAGGTPVIRLISAPFTGNKEEGIGYEGKPAWLQDQIITWARLYKVPILETPLRTFSTSRYVQDGTIDSERLEKHVSPISGKFDGQLSAGRTISGLRTGYCDTTCDKCPNQCMTTTTTDPRALPVKVLLEIAGV